MTAIEIGLRREIIRNLNGLLSAAHSITEDYGDAEDLVEAAVSGIYLDDHSLATLNPQRLRVRLYKALVDSAPDEWLPGKALSAQPNLRQELNDANDGSGSAINDVLDGDESGHDGVADVLRQLKNNSPEPNLDQLRPMTRLIMLLKTREHFTYQEIARICGITEADVRSFLQLGRLKLVREIVNQTLSDNQSVLAAAGGR